MEATQKETNGSANGTAKIPDWLVGPIFEDVLSANVDGFQKITNFRAYPAMAAGENYATLMLRVELEVELKDSQSKALSYMLKIPIEVPLMQEMMESLNIFQIEQDMYLDVVPEMEQMLKDVGVEVKFSAKCFKLQANNGQDCIMLEDLRNRGFKNANRLEGLDMEHTQSVLKKMAQWHAASATRVATKGMYAECFLDGFLKDSNINVIKTMFEGFTEPLIKCMKSYEGKEQYYDDVTKLQHQLTNTMFNNSKLDPNEFNVLNHGDCWCNNIMFQYDDQGKIQETYFVDYQIPKYGSPAQDLLYFILSSTQYELKLKEFDFFIKFYHDQLLEHLQLLKYPKKMPTLKDIHIMLFKYGFWGYTTATGVMGAVLLDPTESANLDNFLSNDEAGKEFKILMYSNPRYRKHIEMILPWLHNRGALDLQ